VNTLILVLIPLVALVAAFFLSWSNLKRILLIWRTQTTALNNLPYEDQVEVAGKVVNNPIQSPITHTPCAMWFLKVTETRGSGRNARHITLYQDASEDAFEIHDEMGSVQILPIGADVIFKTDITNYGGWFHSLDEQTTAQLQSLGIDTKGFLGINRNISVEESYIVGDDPVYVLGSVMQKNEGRVIGRPTKTSPLLISDRSERSLLLRLYLNVSGTIILPIALAVIVDLSIK
jgi:hypothetical protein